MQHLSKKRAHDVFGMSNVILPDSYVDRGELDAALARVLDRRVHVAIRGASKSGKSWLRQRMIPDAITVQCRLGFETVDVYRARSQLGIKLIVEETSKSGLKGRVEASASAGSDLLLKVGVKAEAELSTENGIKTVRIGQDINDLRFIVQLLIASARRLVIEDLHYMSTEARNALAFDMKALWDYGCFIVVVGVWGDANMLIDLNDDLSGRVEELTIDWHPDDLRKIMENGGQALGIKFSRALQNKIVIDAFGNAGLLQRLVLRTLEEAGVDYALESPQEFDGQEAYVFAAMAGSGSAQRCISALFGTSCIGYPDS